MAVHDRQRLERWYRASLVGGFSLFFALGYYGEPWYVVFIFGAGIFLCAAVLGVVHERIRADQQREIDKRDEG